MTHNFFFSFIFILLLLFCSFALFYFYFLVNFSSHFCFSIFCVCLCWKNFFLCRFDFIFAFYHLLLYQFTVSQRSGIRKYVVWCLICGGLSCILGIMFLGVYFLVRSYTSTIGYFETVPTFVPATLVS